MKLVIVVGLLMTSLSAFAGDTFTFDSAKSAWTSGTLPAVASLAGEWRTVGLAVSAVAQGCQGATDCKDQALYDENGLKDQDDGTIPAIRFETKDGQLSNTVLVRYPAAKVEFSFTTSVTATDLVLTDNASGTTESFNCRSTAADTMVCADDVTGQPNQWDVFLVVKKGAPTKK